MSFFSLLKKYGLGWAIQEYIEPITTIIIFLFLATLTVFTLKMVSDRLAYKECYQAQSYLVRGWQPSADFANTCNSLGIKLQKVEEIKTLNKF